jgi:GT2 family glycosyltransferase
MLTRLSLAARWLTDGRLLARMDVLRRALPEAWLIARSDLFVTAWYARDGKVSGGRLALALHYVLRGAAEGRTPSPHFDGDFYLRRYPELALAAQNPLAHYLRHGRHAGYETASAPLSALTRLPLTAGSLPAWTADMDRTLATSGRAPLPRLSVAGVGASGQEDDADYVLLAPPGVRLHTHALRDLRIFLAATPDLGLVYGDEASMAPGSVPWFKPDWDHDLFRAGDLTGPATVFSRALLGRLGWDGAIPDAAGLRALAERAVASGCHIGHMPRILSYREQPATFSRVASALPAPAPLVSVIIPTRDRARLLAVAASGILQGTSYDPLELIIVDNGSVENRTRLLLASLAGDSRVRILQAAGPFNWSALNNEAARSARGDVLLFLNNDVEIRAAGWLTALVAQAVRPDIGAAGARLLYPDGTIQHAGITIDDFGIFRHVMRGAAAGDEALSGPWSVTRCVAAVTGACLATRRDVFGQMGGFDEASLAVTHNDIDYCLAVRAAGYRVVETPEAVLVHHEAASRGGDRSARHVSRMCAERDHLRRRWGGLAETDPYMNANLCLLRDRPALERPDIVWRRLGPFLGGVVPTR